MDPKDPLETTRRAQALAELFKELNPSINSRFRTRQEHQANDDSARARSAHMHQPSAAVQSAYGVVRFLDKLEKGLDQHMASVKMTQDLMTRLLESSKGGAAN